MRAVSSKFEISALGANLRIYDICFRISLRLPDAFSGAATTPFSREITQVLMSPINETDVEIKPDGKYRLLHTKCDVRFFYSRVARLRKMNE